MALLNIFKKKAKTPQPVLSFDSSGKASLTTSANQAPALTGTNGGSVGGSNTLQVKSKAATPYYQNSGALTTSGRGSLPPLLQQGASGSTTIDNPLLKSAVPLGPSNSTSLQSTKPKTPTTSLAGTPTSPPVPSPTPTQGPTNSYSMQGATTGGGFTSTDPAVLARNKAMSDAATASANAQRSPVSTPPVNTPIASSSSSSPAYTPPVSSGPSIIDQLRTKIGTLGAPSAEERALQDQLSQLQGDAAQGIAGLEGQGRGIPLSLVRGQQAKLGEQAQLQEQTLMDRLANMSAQRQAELQAAQNQYNIAANEQARQDQLTAPLTVGNSILRFNPATGQYETAFTAPQEAADSPTSVQEFQFAQQQGFGGSYTDFLSQKAAYSQNPANLQFVSPNANFGGGVFNPNTGQFEAAPTQQKPVSQLTQDAYSLIGSLINHPGLEGATGTVRVALPGSPAADFKAQLERLKSLLSLENIQYLKGTGAISDREGQLLSSAAAALDPKMSEAAFKQELQRIQGQLQGEISGQENGVQSDPRYQQLKGAGFTDQEISEYLGFNSAPSTAVKGSIVSVPLGNKTVQVSSDLGQRLALADADYFRATGKHISVSEGLRSTERQAQLYQAYKNGQGGRAAPPGQSYHETGNAIDVNDWQAVAPYLNKYGLKNELADDRHHFSLNEFA